jgi:ABC-type dipeptide/oligopeptide/nickel transport system permease component
MLKLLSSVVMTFAIVTIVVFIALRLYAGYIAQARIGALEQQVLTLERQHEVTLKAYDAQLSEIETVLFGTIEPKVQENAVNIQQRLPARVELWQKNRDKELRNRIERLERLSLDLTSQMRRLERRMEELR